SKVSSSSGSPRTLSPDGSYDIYTDNLYSEPDVPDIHTYQWIHNMEFTKGTKAAMAPSNMQKPFPLAQQPIRRKRLWSVFSTLSEILTSDKNSEAIAMQVNAMQAPQHEYVNMVTPLQDIQEANSKWAHLLKD
ncbi:unnamed protein product, partial [Meganyctiphanes norvegica]